MRFLLVIILALISGCAAQQNAIPGNVTFALDPAPTNLDPRIGLDASSERIDQQIFSGLVRRDEKIAIQPDLAERWDTPDSQTYVFHLRTDARFHDGRPVTAKDVVYTFKTMMDGTVQTIKGSTYRSLQSVEAPDAYTVVFKLKEPDAPFLWNLTSGVAGIVPEGAPTSFAQKPIGSGPFKFVHYIQDSEVVIERNDDYYGAKPNVKRVTFKIIPEAIVRALELRKGSVDMVAGANVMPPDMDDVFRHDDKFSVITDMGTNYQYLAFNLRDPAFQDVRVRQAIAFAIDREKIIKYVLRGEGRLATGVIPPNNWAYEPNVKTYPYDPARARQLLKESGHSGLNFTFKCSTDDTTRLIAAVLQQQLKVAGIQMEIRTGEFATFFADVQQGNFQAYSLRWVGGNNDPDIFDAVFNSKRIPPNGSNRGYYANPEVDRLIEIGRRESDVSVRRQAYSRIQQILAEELPYVSLWYWDNVAVLNKRIQGMKLYPAGDYDFLSQIRTTDARLAYTIR